MAYSISSHLKLHEENLGCEVRMWKALSLAIVLAVTVLLQGCHKVRDTYKESATPKAIAGGAEYVLTSGINYHYVGPGKPVDCPNGCKDLFYTDPIGGPPGTTITSIIPVDRSPKQNNHWYRCQKEADCGVAEFSDVNQHNKDCVGTPACIVWRATNGSNHTEQDVIDIKWQ